MNRLAELHADTTRRLILRAALDVLEGASVSELTVREVARICAISERTVFRHFPDREALLDAIAEEARREMALPKHPRSVQELLALPAALYERFEAAAPIVRAMLHTDLWHRMRDAQARERWAAVRAIVDREFPRAPAAMRRRSAANIRFFLAASTWRYYREYFGFSLADSIASAELAVRQALEALRTAKPKRSAD
jgi:AcrR family transcriptional regulator